MTESEFEESHGDAIPVKFTLAAAPHKIGDIPTFFESQRASGRHIATDCPLYRLAPGLMASEKAFVTAVLAALRPAAALADAAAALASPLGGGAFNALHLLSDVDWMGQCFRCARAAAARCRMLPAAGGCQWAACRQLLPAASCCTQGPFAARPPHMPLAQTTLMKPASLFQSTQVECVYRR